MRLDDSSLFLFSNPKNTQGPSETFYNAVSDGLISLKIPQIPKVPPRHLGIWGIFAKISAFLIFTVNSIALPITNAEFFARQWRGVFHADAIVHFTSGPCTAVSFAVGFAAYSELLPQSTAVAFILGEVAANGVLMEYHSMMVWWQDRSWMWYRYSWVSCVSLMVIFLVGKTVCCIPNFSVMESLPFKSESAGLYLSLFNRYKDI